LPLHQARLRGDFPSSYDDLWARLKGRAGDKPGTRHMIEVLLLHRRHPRDVVFAAVEKALQLGAIDPAVIALFARQLAHGRWSQFEPAPVGERARFDRPLPSTAAYDSLLAAVAR